MKYRAGMTNLLDNQIIPKYFVMWKSWLLKRKRIQKAAFRLLAYRKKPGLMQAFLKWKNGLPLVVNTLKKYTRD